MPPLQAAVSCCHSEGGAVLALAPHRDSQRLVLGGVRANTLTHRDYTHTHKQRQKAWFGSKTDQNMQHTAPPSPVSFTHLKPHTTSNKQIEESRVCLSLM